MSGRYEHVSRFAALSISACGTLRRGRRGGRYAAPDLALLAAHGVAIVADMGLSVSGQRGEWAALSVAVCVHKKKEGVSKINYLIHSFYI